LWRITQRCFSASLPHQPVMVTETLNALNISSLPSEAIVVDATFGAGGHTTAILESHSDCKVYCIDQDQHVFESERFQKLQERFGERVIPCLGNFRKLQSITRLKSGTADAVMFDLGMSSMQVDSSRGFSFRSEFEGELDMRMSPDIEITAKDIVNNFTEAHLATIFHKLGEELAARRVAQGISAYRQKKEITTTTELSEIIAKYVRKSRINPATKVFQALRIYVNDEINALVEGIQEMEYVLKPNGRCAFLSYHSLEDKMVKNFLKYASGQETHGQTESKPTFSLLHKKVIKPTKEEIQKNIRARSAKLRVAIRTEETKCVANKFFTRVSSLKTALQC